MSRLVTKENEEKQKLFNLLQKMESEGIVSGLSPKTKNKILNGSEDLDEIDTKKLQKQLLTMNQICQKLVTSQDNQAPWLQPGVPLKISVLSGINHPIPTIFRCKIGGAVGPVKLKIDYSLQVDIGQVDLAIMYSTKNKNPTSSNCDKRYISKPKVIVLYPKDDDGKKVQKFTEDSLYFSFNSDAGCSLEVTFFRDYEKNQKQEKDALSA